MAISGKIAPGAAKNNQGKALFSGKKRLKAVSRIKSLKNSYIKSPNFRKRFNLRFSLIYRKYSLEEEESSGK
jgi:hypothetical protein